MIVSLRNSKARLSELVELASRGEDVLITVRGKVRARLTRVGAEVSDVDRAAWIDELRASLASQNVLPAGTMQEALEAGREERG
ncbi:MAG: type II toxin-antitoxin system Phd/YefM family antitoxin [Candidatus Xenobia bacterium]